MDCRGKFNLKMIRFKNASLSKSSWRFAKLGVSISISIPGRVAFSGLISGNFYLSFISWF